MGKKVFIIYWILILSITNSFSETKKLTTEEDILNIYKSEIGRAHVRTPVTSLSRMPSSA